MPGEQALQASARLVPPDMLPAEPFGQYLMQAFCPERLLKDPGSQGAHVVSEMAPVVPEARPGAQGVQATEPLTLA